MWFSVCRLTVSQTSKLYISHVMSRICHYSTVIIFPRARSKRVHRRKRMWKVWEHFTPHKRRWSATCELEMQNWLPGLHVYAEVSIISSRKMACHRQLEWMGIILSQRLTARCHLEPTTAKSTLSFPDSHITHSFTYIQSHRYYRVVTPRGQK